MNVRAWPAKLFHPSYGLGWASIGLLVGLGLSPLVTQTLPSWLFVGLVICALGLLIGGRLIGYVLLSFICIIIGISHGYSKQASLEPIGALIGQKVTVSGVIVEDPHLSDRGDTRLVMTDIVIDDETLPGQLWVTLRGEEKLGRGDIVTINGTLKEGFGPYAATLAYGELGDVVVSTEPIRQLRDRFAGAVRDSIVEPAASLGLGFVIGQRSSLPAELDDQLRIVGLTHLVVASGYNLTILVRFSKRLLERVSKFLTAALSLLLMFGFIAVSGASPSMIRAGLVTGLTIAAWYYGRKFHPALLIVYVMALTAMINPMFLWADIGWWLSFLAFAGVLIIAPMIMKLIHRRGEQPNSLIQIVYETTAAQIMTLPLILLLFGQLPTLSLVANLLAAPFIPLAMALTFLAGVTAMVAPWLAAAIALPAEIILSYFVWLIDFLARPSWAQQAITFDVFTMVVCFAVVAAIAGVIWWRTKFDFRSKSIID